ncbi:MAG: copper amine oxidase N-terminal domain-containing protein, partial [Anaerotignum sp.]|nr:copper amine oxidase N-terminal domain-containing protein [Anaerotignum sp.]
EAKNLYEPLIFNESGRMMIAAKDVPMIMEGRAADSILWNKVSRTVTVQAGEKIFSMSEGQQKWLYQGQEMQADTAPEIRNGIMYLPLRDMAKVFGFDELTWDSSTQTVRLFRSSY